MGSSEELVSVIIPVFNGAQYLSEAIESVLSQTYRPIEVILVNDGSTDGTAVVAKRFLPRIQYVLQANAGVGAARNLGVSLARGDYFAFIDADDIWEGRKIERQIALFRDDQEIDVVFGCAKQFFSPELTPSERAKIKISDNLLPAFTSSGMLIKRTAFYLVGLFAVGLPVGTDMDWYIRGKEAHLREALVNECTFYRRLHRTNMGIVNKKYFNERLRILKEAVDRRRKLAVEKK